MSRGVRRLLREQEATCSTHVSPTHAALALWEDGCFTSSIRKVRFLHAVPHARVDQQAESAGLNSAKCSFESSRAHYALAHGRDGCCRN